MIIFHYTGMESAREAVDRLCDPESKVSAHYLIDEEGGLWPLVEEEHRAWHAGIAHWDGIEDVNSHSIGIEIANPGHEFGYKDFPEKQIEALKELGKGLIAKYKIPAYRVLGHSDIAPKRKEDPGEKFPWEELANHFIGLWPSSRELDFKKAQTLLDDEKIFKEHLAAYGYDTKVTFDRLITSYHRHFYPEKFKAGQDPSKVDLLSAARLEALIRLKKIVKA